MNTKSNDDSSEAAKICVPFLSKANVARIEHCLNRFRYDIIVEYGIGASTRYYLPRILQNGFAGKYVGVETSKAFFKEFRKMFLAEIGPFLASEETSWRPWSSEEINEYKRMKSQCVFVIPPVCSRIKTLHHRIHHGFVHGKEPGYDPSKSKWRNRIDLRVYRLSLLTGGLSTSLRYLFFTSPRPHDADMLVRCTTGATLNFHLRADFTKDQYGDSLVYFSF